MKKALLVIDMQKVCVGKNHADFFKYEENLISSVNQVIDENQDHLIIYIRNVMKKGFISKFAPIKAYEGSEEIELADELHIISDHVFDKYQGDAFSNEQLDKFLKANKIEEIELVGVDGGGCVALTAQGACKAGYQVVMNTKAIDSMFKAKEQKFQKKLTKLGVVYR